MKNIKILFVLLLAIGIYSCNEEDELVFTAQPDPEGISFSNATFLNQYILTDLVPDNIVERFIWNAVDFDAPVNITYELQASFSEDFSSFQVVETSTTSTEIPVTMSMFLSLAEEAGLDNDPETDNPNTGELYFRVVAYPGNGGSDLAENISEIQSISVFLLEPVEEEEEIPLINLFFVGNAVDTNKDGITEDADWNNNATNTPMFRDPESTNLQYFTGYFAAGFFKLLEVKGQWQPQWGTNDGTTLAGNDGTGSDPNSFEVATAGYYELEVNLDEATFTLEPYDESGDTTYTSIAIIGDATPNGWDDTNDTDMTQSAFNPHIWYLTGLDLTDGEMKFRADDSWAVNWGAGIAISGQGVQEGPNNPVTAGTYDIWFNDLTGRYILIPIE